MQYNIILLSIIFLFSLPCKAQSEVEERMKELQEKTKKNIQKQEQQVKNYINKQDSLFSIFLKKEWESYRSDSEPSNFKSPKPKKTPQTKPQKPDRKQKPEKEASNIPAPEPVEPAPPQKDISVEEPTTQSYEESQTINFYGKPIEIYYNNNFLPDIKPPFNNKKISKVWKNMARTEHKEFVNNLERIENELKLNDWGVYCFIDEIGQKLTSSSHNKVVFNWFFLTKLGYQTKIGIEQSSLHLLIASNSMLYSYNYITIDSKNYFLVNNKEESNLKLETYEKDHPKANKLINLKLSTIPLLNQKLKKKNLSFQYNNKKYNLEVNYNPHLIDFLSQYPQTDYGIYLNSPMTPSVKSSLIKSLKPHIEGMTRAEAVSFLLSFVQKAFKYKRDQDNFGYEKPMFPEETLYYDYSDCEDRAALFSFLVQEIIGLESIGLKYPGHLATGINLDGVEGSTIAWKNQNYVICDPTYINSRIGQIIPKFKDDSPEIIVP